MFRETKRNLQTLRIIRPEFVVFRSGRSLYQMRQSGCFAGVLGGKCIVPAVHCAVHGRLADPVERLLILGQIAVLRRRYQLIQLLQLPMAFLFGWFTDVGMLIAGLVPVNSYSMQLVMVVLGIVILGFGVALSVIANVMFNAGEGFVKALSDVTEKNFGDVKIAFDIFSVSLSVVLSLALFGGKVVGLREGTLIASICTGLAVKFFTKRLKTPLDQVLTR